MALLLAVDQGTTSSRAMLFDEAGCARGIARREHRTSYPRPGWVEQDPEDLARHSIEAVEQVLAEAGATRTDVAALGLTNQRETVVVWDRRTGRAVHPAIVWQDRRTADACARLKADGLEPRVQEVTGLLLDPYFSATKVAWILDHVEGARADAEAGRLAFGTVDAWLLHRLTDGRVHATDPTNASRTLLYDLRKGAWDEGLLRAFGVPRGMLPEVVPSSGVVAEAAHGVPGAPIAGLAGDQQAALVGQACFAAGEAKVTYGTGCFLLLHTGGEPTRSRHRLLATRACAPAAEAAFALEGSVFAGGALLQWLRDGLGLVAHAADVERLAATVPDSGGVTLVPAFAGLGAPHWDPHARGTVLGLTQGTRAGHLARAALEAIALQVADVLDAMHADTGARPAEIRVDGGVAASDLLLQIQADLLQVPVVRPRVRETTALGAALLAGLAVGTWRDPRDLASTWVAERRFEPRLPADHASDLRSAWARGVERSRDWAK